NWGGSWGWMNGRASGSRARLPSHGGRIAGPRRSWHGTIIKRKWTSSEGKSPSNRVPKTFDELVDQAANLGQQMPALRVNCPYRFVGRSVLFEQRHERACGNRVANIKGGQLA